MILCGDECRCGPPVEDDGETWSPRCPCGEVKAAERE